MLPAIVRDLGDRALVLHTVRLPGNVSGLELEREQAQLLTLRDGRAVLFRVGQRGCEPPARPGCHRSSLPQKGGSSSE